MVMHGVYNAETLEKLINIIHQIYNITTASEISFSGKFNTAFTWYLNKNVFHHYAKICFYISEH